MDVSKDRLVMCQGANTYGSRDMVEFVMSKKIQQIISGYAVRKFRNGLKRRRRSQ